jgi:hypothetical protein
VASIGKKASVTSIFSALLSNLAFLENRKIVCKLHKIVEEKKLLYLYTDNSITEKAKKVKVYFF